MLFIKLLLNLILYFGQRGGSSIAILETTGGEGVVQVNGKIIEKKSSLILNGGDEVVFSSSGKHAYVSFLNSSQCSFLGM